MTDIKSKICTHTTDYDINKDRINNVFSIRDQKTPEREKYISLLVSDEILTIVAQDRFMLEIYKILKLHYEKDQLKT